MSLRVIQAPGVQINEIDKSQYSPSMVGTACYVMGFANKGEAYIPMEFTSRAAWTNYYGEPDNEAERYFYNACVEVLNQNGRLYCARLPYSNASFEKIVGVKYNVVRSNVSDNDVAPFEALWKADSTISKENIWKIWTNGNPTMTDLSTVDEYRTDESKVAAGTFMIFDRTCASYKKIQEDDRKGIKREVLGIVPVITTAANALYAQNLIDVEPKDAYNYETVGDIATLDYDYDGSQGRNYISAVTDDSGAFNNDLVRPLNSKYKGYSVAVDALVPEYNTIGQLATAIQKIADTYVDGEDPSASGTLTADNLGDWVQIINNGVDSIKALFNEDNFTETNITEEDKQKLKDEIATAYVSNTDTLKQVAEKVQLVTRFMSGYVTYHAKDGDDSLPNTLAFDANSYFPSISYNTVPNPDYDESVEGSEAMVGRFDRDNFKKIGVVVYRAYIDPSEGNKIAFEPIEAFAGSLFKEDKNKNTGVTEFIDTIINTQSQYIYFFSNCFNKPAEKKLYKGTLDTFVVCADPSDKLIKTPSLGFYEYQVEETIDVAKSIYDGMNKCFDKVQDINERNIDIVPDAGIANIASFLKAVFGGRGKYDLDAPLSEDQPEKSVCSMWKADKLNDAVKTWKAVEQKFDTFCKSTRKDCMFIADGLRPLVVAGQKKIIRESKPSNTIDANILPYIKNLMGLNTSYGAGYIDWFQVADEFTGDLFWCPPSIKAMGSYIYTDLNFNYWDAPAGLTRGIVAAVDVAFSPTPKQAGAIYEKNWNFAINYPNDGIVLEGQKTFQVKPSAFDRVNVRRLFLRLERAAYQVARYFVYEGNTAYTRQRLVDALDPYFKAAKVGGGVYDYKIRCDESINTPTVIDNNELRVQIGIKPVKTAEFILIDFIALSTGGSFEEAMG